MKTSTRDEVLSWMVSLDPGDSTNSSFFEVPYFLLVMGSLEAELWFSDLLSPRPFSKPLDAS